MTRLRDESGFTLQELLVAMVVTLLIFAATLTMLQVFLRQDGRAQAIGESQDTARSALDRLSRELRNVASPTAGSAGALEKAGPYDIVFQSVAANQVYGGANASNQVRVRYCLDASNPSSETLWRQTQSWTSAAAPALPSTATCPATAWTTSQTAVTHVTNQARRLDRPLFAYGPGTPTSTASIQVVQIDLFVNAYPAQQPADTELTGGVSLRNSLAPPVAAATCSAVNGYASLDASSSSDPQGQALSYQWSQDGTSVSGATSQHYSAGPFTHGTSHTFSLTVINTGGLSSSYACPATAF